MTRQRKPLTVEDKARRADVNRAWRKRRAAHLRRYEMKTRDARNARRRKKYATKAEPHRARCRSWKRRNADRVREYNRKVINPQRRAGGKYDRAKYITRSAWRTFVAVCAKNREQLRARSSEPPT